MAHYFVSFTDKSHLVPIGVLPLPEMVTQIPVNLHVPKLRCINFTGGKGLFSHELPHRKALKTTPTFDGVTLAQ